MPNDLPNCLTAEFASRSSWRIPLDERDLTVRLECDGVTNTVASDVYGFPDVHEMAAAWYPAVSTSTECEIRQAAGGTPILDHLRGTAFALPLAICCAAMLCFGYSLWGGDLNGSVAAAVAIGTVASFVVTGGVVQAMAWQGLFYAGSGDFRMSAVACQRWTCYGGLALASAAGVGLLLNAQYGWLSGNLAWVATAFYFALGVLWIGTGILYIVEAPLQVAAATIYGVAVVAVLHRALHLPLLVSQIAGVLTAAGAAFLTGFAILRKRRAADGGRIYPRMLQRTAYLTAPYVVYGSLYYLLLFTDRLIAWTAQSGAAATPVTFRGDYEFPHDIALIGFIIGVGWVHASSLAFYARVSQLLHACTLDQTHAFNNRMRHFHLLRIAAFLPAAYAANVAIWFMADHMGLLAAPLAGRIALIALAAFPWLTVGLWNVSLLFALSLPWAVLPPTALAVLANLGCGYALSRIWSYDLAVIGFLVGATVFGIGSSIAVRHRLSRLDYFYLVSGA